MGTLFGLETEYGIAVEEASAADLVALARSIVSTWPPPYGAAWDYAVEDPRHDMRGFRVHHLARDPVDRTFDRTPVPAPQPRCDRLLPNGGRLYDDHGHPEYATPECRDLMELLAQHQAGDRIILECAERYQAHTGRSVAVFKNNTDFHGASYGHHESYLMTRAVPWDRVLRNLATFLATRPVFAGAGKVGSENQTPPCPYQLSQRADFCAVLQSVDTLYRRPLVNTRDEVHGEPGCWRRLHVIAGDANMSEYATALRVGATALVVALCEAGWEVPAALRDPLAAVRTVSRDLSCQTPLPDDAGGMQTALEFQRQYLRAAQELAPPGFDWVLAEWAAVLDGLRQDPLSQLRLDWVAKYTMLDQYARAEGLSWQEHQPELQSLDLAYHDLDAERSLFSAACELEPRLRMVSEAALAGARCSPPEHTRAALRGLLVRRFGEAVVAGSWEWLTLQDDSGCYRVRLPLVEADAVLEDLRQRLAEARDAREVAGILGG